MRNTLLETGRLRLLLFAGFLLLALTAQLFNTSSLLYPFVNWTMYADAAPPPEYPHDEAQLESGNPVIFPLHRVTPATSARSFVYSFSSRVRTIAELEAQEPVRVRTLAASFVRWWCRVCVAVVMTCFPHCRSRGFEAKV